MRIRYKAAGLAFVASLLSACASDGQGIETTPSNDPSIAANTPIGAWYLTVQPGIAHLEQSITYAQQRVRRPDHLGVGAACRSIRLDVRSVRAAPDAPDAALRHALSRETEAFAAAATQCLSGDFHRAGHSVNVGHHWAEVGGRRLRTLLHLPAKAGVLL